MKERELNFSINEDQSIVSLSKDNQHMALAKYQELNTALNVLFTNFENNELTVEYMEILLCNSETYLRELLNAYGYQGVLKKAQEKRSSEIRSLHAENRELRKQLGGKVTNEDAREKLKILSKIIKNWWRKEGFGHVSNISYSDFGTCEIKLSCHMFGDFRLLDDETPISSKAKKIDWIQELKDQGYKIIKDGNHDWQLIDNDSNRDLIYKMITAKFPSSWISSFKNWHSRRKYPIIRDIIFCINDLNDI